MSNSRYWVVGGEYRSLDFAEVVDGTQRLIGPFDQRDKDSRVTELTLPDPSP